MERDKLLEVRANIVDGRTTPEQYMYEVQTLGGTVSGTLFFHQVDGKSDMVNYGILVFPIGSILPKLDWLLEYVNGTFSLLCASTHEIRRVTFVRLTGQVVVTQ